MCIRDRSQPASGIQPPAVTQDADSDRGRERKRQLREREQRAEAIGAPMPYNPDDLPRARNPLPDPPTRD
eukprot:14821694-Alexandrium_andersonii.AAC.1